MTDGPALGDRDQAAVFETLLDRADVYTDEWDPETPDSGRALLRIFSQFEADLRTRLAEVPDKHRLAFLDALDFDRRPPQAASAPLSFQVSTEPDRNVAIPAGTQAVAETAGGSTRVFELPQAGGFEATGAELTDVLAVDPSTDRIVDHGDALSGGEPVELFTGPNRQEHVLYLGAESALTLDGGSSVTISLTAATDADRVFDAVEWEYYGVGPDGTEGWHRLPEAADGEADEDVGVELLQERLQSRSVSTDERSVDGDGRRGRRTYTFPGPTVAHAVADTESRWLRCRRRADCRSVSATLHSLSVHVGCTEGREPDGLLSNDVPLSPAETIRPFGRMPHPPSTFYVSCEEAFTKPGGVVELEFVPPTDGPSSTETDAGEPSDRFETGVVGGPPHLSWEYWNGEGWTRLASVSDETAALTTGGAVSFEVPDDIEATTVSGHENVWIRSRLVSGNYGQPQFEVTEAGGRGRRVDEPASPVFESVIVHYDRGERPFETVLGYNNAAYSADLAGTAGSFAAFRDLPDEQQTVYFGFDDTLRNGPLTLFVPVEDATYPQSFDTGVQWEYWAGSEGWSKLDVRDGTGGLTERGIVTMTFPTPTAADEFFGRERHWIRARTTKDEFDLAADGSRRHPTDGAATTSTDGASPSADPEPPARLGGDSGTAPSAETANAGSDRAAGSAATAASDPATLGTPEPSQVGGRVPSRAGEAEPATPGVAATASAERTAPPPVLEGLYPNTQWAYNTTTIDDEILGSSDGSHAQSFACSHAPLIDVEVWVDERSKLSAGDRRRLLEERPDGVEPEYDSRGEFTAFWVRWEAVADFLDSEPTDRHYVSNRTLGELSFGDGDSGAIPPAGQDNVKATYTTGGGRDGNVDAGTITTLNSSIALVESVTNPMPADGGADTESTDALLRRATNRLKHRGRAVTPRDYEQVAMAAFPELATVSCDPALDPVDGRARVPVLIVPQTEREKPVPSMELKHRVRDVLYDRAPASVVADDAADIIVRGPDYCEVSVEATIRAETVKSVSQLKRTITDRLDSHLHPLTGNDGDGWGFGELPAARSLVDRVGAVADVADVLEFDVTLTGGGDRRTLSRHDEALSLPRDTLPCSGRHELTVTMGETR